MDSRLSRRQISRWVLAVLGGGLPSARSQEAGVAAMGGVPKEVKRRFLDAAREETWEGIREAGRRAAEEAKAAGRPHPPAAYMRVARLVPFGDWDFYYVRDGDIIWGPDPGPPAPPVQPGEPIRAVAVRIEVTVPEGFVTDLASIPRAFWAIRRPEGRHAYAAVVHDYLYWTQGCWRAALPKAVPR